jgi:predicted ATPase
MSALAEEGLLTFNHGDGRWSWDVSRMRDRDSTNNVVDLMVGTLSRLLVDAQNALQRLACLGNSAEFATWRMICPG